MAKSDVESAEVGGGGAFSRFEWMMALRYLRARRKESFISIISGFSFLGITLGVAVLIIVMSVMNGFRAELLGKILGINGHIIVQTPGTAMTDYDRLADLIVRVPGVERVAPIIDGQVMASAPAGTSGVLVRGMRRSDLETLDVVADNLQNGSFEAFDASDSVFIGRRLAEKLNVGLGSRITLISPSGPVTPFGTAPRMKAYKVGGIFEIGMSEYDASFVFMPLEEAQLYFNRPGAVGALEVMVDDPDAVGRQSIAILEAADRPIRVLDWQQMNSSFFNALMVERNVMFLILTLIILVAALNIISGLIMLVKDKGRDIAILRTMGASPGTIMRVFFIAGASIGVTGTLGGTALGILFCENIETVQHFVENVTGRTVFNPEIYFLSNLPAEIDVRETIAVVVMALVLSFSATLYPSWRAARLDPVEALRYE